MRCIPPPNGARPIIELTHDLGTILAAGQELRHEFTLENRTDRPIRPIRPTAHAPCCSAVGPVPGSIPPGGSVGVPVVFKTGAQKGVKRLIFSVESDRPDAPTWRLALECDLVPAWDIEPIGDRLTRVRVGASAERSARLICRRRGGDGLALPAAVEASGPLSAAFDGPAEEAIGPGGLITASRRIRLTYRASADPGPASGLLTFRWPDPETPPRDLEFRWTVTPSVSVEPASLILRGDPWPSARSVIVRSLDRPFRVLGADGPLAGPVAPSPEARTVQALDLAIDPARLPADDAADVLIRTDHPDHPEVTLTVLLLNASQGDAR